jgi:mannose-6-phosphate isomerase-like protein (cupin superfamily)
VSGYTKLNLVEDVENSAEKFGMGDVLAAHFARKDIEAKQFGLSLQRLKPNQRMPFGHRHETQEEVYVVASGSGRFKLEDDIVEVGRWDAVRVDPEVMRSLEAGPDGMDVIAFGAPGVPDTQQEMGWWSETD